MVSVWSQHIRLSKKPPTPRDIFDTFPSDISALHFELGIVKHSKLSCGYDFGTNDSVAVGVQLQGWPCKFWLGGASINR